MEIQAVGEGAVPKHNREGRRALARLQRTRMQSDVGGDALLMLEAVMARTGLGRSTIYALMAKAAGAFPAPVKLSPRCVRWRASDVSAWLAAQAGA